MTYWHIQMYKTRDGQEKELLKEKALIGIGENNPKQIEQFKKNMNIGDIVLVRKGAKVYALVEVLGEVETIKKDYYKDTKNKERIDWFKYRRKIKVLAEADESMEKFPQVQGNLTKLVTKTTASYQYIDNWYTKILQKDYDNKNLINGSYKIKEFYIKDNQKTFQNFKINFTSDGKTPLPLIVIAGKNGTGKTTLLEYLADFSIEKDDYIEIFKVREAKELELWDDSELIVDNFNIRDGMKGIQAIKKEYMENIEYLPVDISRIENVKDFILDRHRKRSRELDSITKATNEIQGFIEEVFDGMDLTFNLYDVDDTDRDNEKVIFKNQNGKEFDIESLSTGEKTLLSKVLYLYFKDVNNKVILIDEPELSLHPAWQNRVLKLYENFAINNNCQVIIATHSPHIIASAKNEWIRVLTEDGVINNILAYGRDIKWVLKEMGVESSRVPEVLTKIEHCKKLLEDDNYDEAEQCIDEIENIIGSHDSEIVALRTSLEFWRE